MAKRSDCTMMAGSVNEASDVQLLRQKTLGIVFSLLHLFRRRYVRHDFFLVIDDKLALKNMLDNHCWDVSAFVGCFDLPNNTFIYPSVRETTKLGLVAPKLPEVIEVVVSRRTVINEVECVLRIKNKTDDDNVGYEGVGLRYWSRCRGRVKECSGLDAVSQTTADQRAK